MKTITGKVNFVGAENILINAGRADGRSISVPVVSFKGQVPEKYQKLDFEVTAVGPKIKRDNDGEVIFKSKSAYVAGFKVLKLWEPEMVIEEEDDPSDNDYNAPF